jgi:hypothetical protein
MEQVIIILLALSVLCLAGVVYLARIRSQRFGYLEKKGRSEGFDVAIPDSLMNSFSGGDVSYFPKIVTTQATEPGSEEIIQKFNQCIAEGRDTVKGCLSSSGAGFKAGVCMKLCKQQYGDLSPYCSSVCTDQQNQVNTSARFGPA